MKSKKEFRKTFIDKFYLAIQTQQLHKAEKIAKQATPEDLAFICDYVSSTWYSQRKYNNLLPRLNTYIEKSNLWYKPTLEWLNEHKYDNGWLFVSKVICTVQLLGKEHFEEIFSILEGTYCDPEIGFKGRDGLSEMMISLLPYIPESEHEKWLSITIECVHEATQLDDKAIALAKICPYVWADEREKLILEAIAALKDNYGACANENAYAIYLLKKVAPSERMKDLLKLETELKTDNYYMEKQDYE